jgi:hypothetical protein
MTAVVLTVGWNRSFVLGSDELYREWGYTPIAARMRVVVVPYWEYSRRAALATARAASPSCSCCATPREQGR